MKTYAFLNEENLSPFQIVKWGYSQESVPKTFDHFEDWVSKDQQGPLSYLSDERKEKRRDIKNVFPEFESALTFLFTYKTEKKRLADSSSDLKVASYVTGFEGADYHHWIKDKLNSISEDIKKEIPELSTFYSIDAQPVLERDLAYKSGLGWFGKNSMLINREEGSYFIIAAIFLNKKLDLESNQVEADHCGTCTRCLDACPTDAINDNRTVDSSKCISTYTIELFKDAPAPEGFSETNWVYGCDICQEVCPWNTKPLKLTECAAKSESAMDVFETQSASNLIDRFESMSNREFKRVFVGTPLARTGREGIMKNLKKIKPASS